MYESETSRTTHSCTPGSSGAHIISSVLSGPLPPPDGRLMRLSAKSSSPSPITSHQPPPRAFGKAGAKAERRARLPPVETVTEMAQSAPASTARGGGAASSSVAGNVARRPLSSLSCRALRVPPSARFSACASSRTSCARWVRPRAASASSAAALIPGRSESGGASRKRPWLTICVRLIAPSAVCSQPASAAMSTMACRMRSAWSSTDLRSVT
mmetsp:Transcript_13463/g.43035  ORF Transcript_13463/g.43035 Transcript_13463/m.43035 type:complete len:213 (+) Transcript_13463:194-832(+)